MKESLQISSGLPSIDTVRCPSCSTLFTLKNPLLSNSDDETPSYLHCSKCDYLFKAPIESAIESQNESENEADGEDSGATLSSPPLNSPSLNSALLNLPPPLKLPIEETPRPKLYSVEGSARGRVLLDTDDVNLRSSDWAPSLWEEERSISKTNPKINTDLGIIEGASKAPPSLKTNDSYSLATISNEFIAEQSMHSGKLLYLVGPIVFVVFILASITYASSANPNFSENLVAKIFKSQYQIPPVGLYLDDLELSQVVLRDGSKFLLVSGNLINQSSKSLFDLKLEAQAYSASGEQLQSAILPIIDPLDRGKLRVLSRGELNDLLNFQNKNPTLVQAGNDYKVMIPVEIKEPEKVAYYSARVFSVREL